MNPDPLVCPGCNGPKTARAKLCRVCRGRANIIGERVWTDTALPTTPAKPRTVYQSNIYHGKCAALARARSEDPSDKIAVNREMRAVKHQALAFASKRFRREIESSTELSEIEMDIVSEWLDDQLDVAEQPAEPA